MEPLLPLLPQYSKWIMTAILSLLSIILFVIFKTYARKQVMIAMLFSSLGDIFMTNAFNMDNPTIPGAAFFIVAHIVYGLCFVNLCKQHGYNYKNIGFYLGIILVVISVIIISIFAFMVESPAYGMYFLILIYIAIIGFNICSNFSYSFSVKDHRTIILPFAILLFYLTDIWIFIDMLGIYSELHMIVWYFYPIAQLLLIVFNDKFRKTKQIEYIYEN